MLPRTSESVLKINKSHFGISVLCVLFVTDMVATLGDVTANQALIQIKQKMQADSVGRQILL